MSLSDQIAQGLVSPHAQVLHQAGADSVFEAAERSEILAGHSKVGGQVKRTKADKSARHAAAKAGLNQYTGDACPTCKNLIRYSASGRCVACIADCKARRTAKAIKLGLKPGRKSLKELFPLSKQEKFMARMLRQWRVWCADSDSGACDGSTRHDQAKGSTGGSDEATVA